MTKTEIREQMNNTHLRQQQALTDIAEVARMLVPLLKDRQMFETAKDLESKLFLLDAIKGEFQEFIKANIRDVLEVILPGASS